MPKIRFIICFAFLFSFVSFSQEQIMCPLECDESTIVEPTIGTENLVVVFVDFPEGRMPDGSMPTVDADTIHFPTNSQINAVG